MKLTQSQRDEMTIPNTKREYPALPKGDKLHDDRCSEEIEIFYEGDMHAYADPLLDEIALCEAETARWQDEFLKASATIERQREVMLKAVRAMINAQESDNPFLVSCQKSITALQAELEEKTK